MINNKQAIEQLELAEKARFKAEKEHPGLSMDANAEQNVIAYQRISMIIKSVGRPTRALLSRSLYEFVNQVQGKHPYQPKQYQAYFRQSGFSAFGMSHVFDGLIADVKRHDKQKLAIFARLGA